MTSLIGCRRKMNIGWIVSKNCTKNFDLVADINWVFYNGRTVKLGNMMYRSVAGKIKLDYYLNLSIRYTEIQ